MNFYFITLVNVYTGRKVYQITVEKCTTLVAN